MISYNSDRCPWCGGEHKLNILEGVGYYVDCINEECPSHIVYKTPQEAMDAWCKRAVVPNDKHECEMCAREARIAEAMKPLQHTCERTKTNE